VRGTPRRDAGIIALVWFMLPVLAMSYTGSPVQPFYQLMGMPAGYVLAAWGIGLLFRPQTQAGAVIVAVLLVPFAALMSVNSARYYQETAAIPGAHGLYALPVGTGIQIGADIGAALPEADGVVFAEAEQWIINSFAGRLFPVWNGTNPPEFAVIPARGGAFVEVSDAPVAPPGATEMIVSELMPRSLLLATLPPAPDADISGLEAANVPSQQGITLVGSTITPDDSAPDAWRARLLYRVDGIAPEVLSRLYQPFLHVFDADDQRIANVGGAALPGSLWSAGDLHYYEIAFTLPSDITPDSAITGLYDAGNNANVICLPPDAEPTAAIPLNISE
jgi:hypothetical protein